MTTRLHFFLLLAGILFFSSVNAQTEDDFYQYGCHFTKNKLHLHSLSDDERSLTCGSNERSDSIDILNYAVTLDVTNFSQQIIIAECEITFTAKQDGIEAIPLDLLDLTVDSVTWQGNPLVFDYDDLLLNVHLPVPVNVNDTMKIRVFYQGHPTADPSGFGGFVFENGYGYNLGIGLSSNPYNFGRSWHPCFDNFVERATYDLNIISNGGRKGYGIGVFQEEEDLGNGEVRRQYRMALPLPTYLVGTATSNYSEIHQTHTGAYGERPILLVGKHADTTQMKTAFTYLGSAVDALEAWYGPYIWGQVGYVMTTAGAMEHATLIAYPDFSIDAGPVASMNRLMAHELAHHWWGNITTLSCPENMWIKEGNAEYGAHLFTEFTFGKKAFVEEVKTNFYTNVFKKAHSDDGGNYLALSPMPYEYTYGTHTYRKGASMMHNLRGYLGDTLFSKGMRAILTDYQFQSVDAEQFRDKLTAETGVDMTSFFNDWIFAPGYAVYELDSVHVAPAGGAYEATVFVQQKGWKTTHLHTDVPLEITFYDKDWNTFTGRIMVSGEYSQGTVSVPFEPVWQAMNDNHQLNIATFQDKKTVYGPSEINLNRLELNGSFDVLECEADSALVQMSHYWGAPDPIEPNPTGVQMSSTHYWRLDGILPDGFKGKAQFSYRGKNPEDIDYDLTNGNENDLILVWRPRPGVAWSQYPFYTKLTIGSVTDGNGFIRIDTMLPGDYAYANGELPVATSFIPNELIVNVFPNPSDGQFTVSGHLLAPATVGLELFDSMGRRVKKEEFEATGRYFHHTTGAEDLQAGVYWLRISDQAGTFVKTNKIIIQ